MAQYGFDGGEQIPQNARGTIAEQLNNAIVGLDFVASLSSSSAGVKKAIGDLALHWWSFYRGAYWSLPDVAWQQKITRYVEWYTRAYALLPSELRAKCRDPRTIDPSFAAVAVDTMARMVEANVTVAQGAAELAREVAFSGVTWVLLLAAGVGLTLYVQSKGAARAAEE